MTKLYRSRQIQDINNATLILSLEWVNRAYSGNAINVRRVSDNATSDFGFVDGEVDYTSIDTWRSGSNVHVRILYDQSPYGNNATNTNDDLTQPQLDTVNKKIIFDVSNLTYLQVADANTLDLDGGDWSLILDANLDGYNNQSSTANSPVVKDTATSASQSYGIPLDNTNKLYLKTGVNKGTSSSAVSIGYRKTWIGTKSGTDAYLYEDNDELATGSTQTGASDNGNVLYIGRDSSGIRYTDMDFYGLFVYKGIALSSTDRRLFNSTPELFIGTSPRRIYGNSTINLFTLREDYGDTTNTFQLASDASYPDTDEINSFLNGANGFFTEWYEQVDNSRKFIQTTTAWQPPYLENAINNKIGMDSQNPITILTRMDLSSALNLETAATFFCVIDIEGNGTGGASVFGNNNFLTAGTFAVTVSGSNVYLRIVDSLDAFDNSGTVAFSTGKSIYTVTCDGIDNIKLYINGVEKINKTVANGFLNKIVIPFFGTFDGKLSEFRIYRSVLSSDVRENIERDIAAFYGIPGY